MLTLLIILVALGLILLAIVKYDIHPFLALFVGAIIYGLMMGMPTDLIVKSISEGFGGVMGSVGLLILLGVIMGTFLEKTGGAIVIANRILKWIGEKFVNLSLMLSGWVLSVPIFGDSTIIMMNPIAKSLASKSKISYAATIVALSLGAMASHALVPPTPGPIAAAAILGADLGQMIIWGLVVSLITLIPLYFFVNKFVVKIPLEPQLIADEQKLEKKEGLIVQIDALDPIYNEKPTEFPKLKDEAIANLLSNHARQIFNLGSSTIKEGQKIAKISYAVDDTWDSPEIEGEYVFEPA